MAIDRETVLHVARLARLDLRPDETDRLTKELGAILDAVSKVAELDLADVPPTSHPLDLVNVWADDEPRPSLSLDEALANAPAREGDLFRVPPDRRARGLGVIDTLRLTAEEALGLIERREVSSAELHAAYVAAAGERDGELHAYLRLVEESEGTGVPIALKDVISTKGVETTAGSRILDGYVPVFDATVAARCKAAGMPVIGKTNTDEFAMGSSTENSAYGPSHNPWDPTRVPGGSGGGTAAAVSGGLAPWGLGSDTGGSIKQPSALVRQRRAAADLRHRLAVRDRRVRLEPRPDRARREDRARRGAALLDHRRAGRERFDDGRASGGGRVADASRRSTARRIGIPKQVWDLPGIEPGVRASFEAAIETARGLGAEIGECDLPLSFDYGMPCYYLIAPAEASSNLARYDGVRYGPRVDAPTYREMVERTRDAGFGDEPKRRIMLGTYALSAGYYDAYYGQAQRVRTLLIREHRAALEQFDVIATPTSPTVAFPIGDKAADPLAMYACDVMTIPSCLAGLPGLNIPSGLSEGLPVGLQLIGRAVRRERAVPGRTCARARDRVRHRHRSGIDEPGNGAFEMTWETVVGLEIHVQLKTRTKMFCRCAAGFGAGENTQTCPVCLGFPGALPVLNRTAIEWTVKLGLALGCEIAPRAVFARKNYFYPDLPKGYQISQYDLPSCIIGQFASAHGGRRPRGRDRPGPSRGGRGEDGARRRPQRADRWCRVLARRLQPWRHTARRDRDRSRHPLGRGGEALPPAAPADHRRARDLGRGDGEGHAARRCQRLGPSGGLRRAAHAVRDQEHELVQLHRPRDRGRGRPPDRRLGMRRGGAPGDIRLRRRLGHR